MKIKICLVVVCLTSFFVTSAYCQSAEEIDIDLKLKEGFSAIIRVVTVDSSSMIIGEDVSSKSWNKTVYDYEIKCEAVDSNGVMEVWQTLKSVKFQKDSIEGKFEYDSSKPGANIPPQVGPLAALVGNSIVMHITPDGTITKVGGIEKIVDDTVVLSQINPDKVAFYKKLSLKEFKDPAKASAAGILRRYPPEITHEGYVWKNTPMQGCDYTYTIKSINQDLAIAKIEQKGNLHFDFSLQDVVTSYSSKGTDVRELYVDLTTGLIVFGEQSSEFHSEIEGGKALSTSTTMVRLISKIGVN